MEHQRFIFANSFSPTFIFIVGSLALALALMAYLTQKRKISLEWKLALLGLRMIAILLMMLTLMRPGVETKQKFIEKAQLFILQDQSQSMDFEDKLNGPSRAKQVNHQYGLLDRELKLLQEHYETQFLDIRNGLIPNEKGFQIDPVGYQTPLTKSLKQFLAETSRKRTIGVVLISDGQDTDGQDPSTLGQQFLDNNLPVYSVGVGEPKDVDGLIDLRAVEIEAPLNTFQENNFVVQGEFQLQGLGNREIEFELLVEDKVVAKEKYTPERFREKKIIQFTHSLEKKGLYKLGLRGVPLEDELSVENNLVETFIEILDGDIKVLYLEGQSRSEFKFLNRAFQQAREIQIKNYLLMGIFQKSPQIPQSYEEWIQYDVIILGDVPKSKFSEQQLKDLHDAIDKGGRGFLMIGGFDNFGNGGYANSPIGDLLPVELSKKDGQFTGYFKPELTSKGQEHFVLRFYKDLTKTLAVWKSLPNLDGYTQVSGVKPTATVLMEHKGKPVLTYFPYGYGKGRSMAFCADTTWKWVLNKENTEIYFVKFWRQMILWLAQRDNLNKEKVWIQVDSRRFPIEQEFPIKVFAQSTAGESTLGVATLELTYPSGKKEKLTSNQNNDGFTFQFKPQETGVFHLNASVSKDGKLVGKDETRVLIFRQNFEMNDPSPNLLSLKLLSKNSEGKYYPLKDLKILLEEIEKKPSAIVIEKLVIADLWDNGFFFLLFILVIGAEWYLRKKKGLA